MLVLLDSFIPSVRDEPSQVVEVAVELNLLSDSEHLVHHGLSQPIRRCLDKLLHLLSFFLRVACLIIKFNKVFISSHKLRVRFFKVNSFICVLHLFKTDLDKFLQQQNLIRLEDAILSKMLIDKFDLAYLRLSCFTKFIK
jgi:hypothetical protein